MSSRLLGTLTGAQRRALRSEAGRRASTGTLRTVTLGANPSTETAARAVDDALKRDELVRVRTSVRKRKEAAAIGAEIASATDAHVAQVLGHTVLIYRANEKGSSLKLPEVDDNA